MTRIVTTVNKAHETTSNKNSPFLILCQKEDKTRYIILKTLPKVLAIFLQLLQDLINYLCDT